MLGIARSELGGCRLTRRIGAGAMGEVYLAEQVTLGNRPVAVKVVRAEHDITRPHGTGGDISWRFIREAGLLGQLTHPNILPAYHSGIEAGYHFLVMQYVPDGSLADAIQGKSALRLTLPAPVPFVIDIVAQLAEALQYTHEHHVIHADVKPSNVLVRVEPNRRWHVLLADFGIARSLDTLAGGDEVAGTAAYMAPEQFSGQLSPACDQYALGVMAYQLLGGRLPFTGRLVELVRAHAGQEPPALRALNPAIPATVEAVIARALAKRPEDRHGSVAAFAQALCTAAGRGSPPLVATSAAGGVWAGPAGDRPDAATSCAAPTAYRTKPSPTPGIAPHDEPRAPRTRRPSPAILRMRSSDGRRRRAPGIAVLALLLVAGVVGIGLRSPIDVTHAFASLRSAVARPTVPGMSSGAKVTPSEGTPPAGQGSSSVPVWPTLTPTAAVTPQPTPQPTASPTGEPTATAPNATVTPTETAIAEPSPTATVQPTGVATEQPAAPATPPPPAP